MDYDFWLKQQPGKPLFPDIAWSKPERRDQSGKLLIVGGNKLGFAAAAEAYRQSLTAGVGEVKVLLPDCLRSSVPKTIVDVVFSACTPSGGLSKDALRDLTVSSEWANGVLCIGDAGRNAETSLVYEEFVQSYEGQLTLTRDAVDLLRNNSSLLVERPNTTLVVSFAQLQKLFSAVYYPKMLTFSMQLMQIIDTLHKFTITYPVSIVTFHQETLIIAYGGRVVTQPWVNPMAIWRGTVATNAASYLLWNPSFPLESLSTSLID